MSCKYAQLKKTNEGFLTLKISAFSNLKIKPQVCPGGTDSRYLRAVGVAALGFSPMNNNTPILLHDHDEFLQADIYLQGIEIYKKIIPAITSIHIGQRWNH